MAPTILITGFGAFPGAPVNPTETLVGHLVKAARRRGIRGIGHVFATRCATVDRELPALIARHRPDAILMFGLAARRRRLCIELCARNKTSARPRRRGETAWSASGRFGPCAERARLRARFRRQWRAVYHGPARARGKRDPLHPRRGHPLTNG